MAVSSAEWRGVRYAFGRGMDPRKKDGVRAHPFVFAGGMILHAGVFSSLAWLPFAFLATDLPLAIRVALAGAQIGGILAGGGLLVRRSRSPVLRVVSVPDDFASTLFVMVFLASAAVSILSARAIPAFLAASLALAVYAPFSKLRHCVLFFVTRTRYGLFVGRRGILGARPGGA